MIIDKYQGICIIKTIQKNTGKDLSLLPANWRCAMSLQTNTKIFNKQE